MADFILPNVNFNDGSSTIMNSHLVTSIYYEHEEERKSLNHNFKRIMFVGKSGVGKSTLLNMFYHSSFNLDVSLDKPSKTSNSASGETDGIACYPNFDQERIYIDTIGLTDNRFSPEEILSAIRTFIRGIVHGLNVIVICINHGRIDADERKTLKTMEVIFGPTLFHNATVIACNSPLVNYSRGEWEKTLDDETKKLSNCKHVLFANNTPGTNTIEQFQEIRKNLIEKFEFIMENNTSDLFKPSDGILERVYDFLQLLFPKIMVPNYQKLFNEMWKEYEKDCSICLCSIAKEQEHILSCNHAFHNNCIKAWHERQQQRLCPTCRQ